MIRIIFTNFKKLYYGQCYVKEEQGGSERTAE